VNPVIGALSQPGAVVRIRSRSVSLFFRYQVERETERESIIFFLAKRATAPLDGAPVAANTGNSAGLAGLCGTGYQSAPQSSGSFHIWFGNAA